MKQLSAAAIAAILAYTADAAPAPVPQGVTANLPASGVAPPGCKPTFPGVFGMTVVPIKGKSKRK